MFTTEIELFHMEKSSNESDIAIVCVEMLQFRELIPIHYKKHLLCTRMLFCDLHPTHHCFHSSIWLFYRINLWLLARIYFVDWIELSEPSLFATYLVISLET